MSIATITRDIIAGNLTNDELNKVILAVQFARKELGRSTKRAISVGSTVKYTSTKVGGEVTGTVKKIAIKFVTVDLGARGLWKVPASMLTAV